MAQFATPPTYALPVIVDEKAGTAVFNPVWLQWFIELTGIINASGGTSLGDHNLLTGLQGGSAGTPGQRYHLTQSEHTSLAGIAALAATGASAVLVKRKTADESVTSSTTFQDDNHLTFAIGANEEWDVEVSVSAGASLTTTGHKYAFTVPAGATMQAEGSYQTSVASAASALAGTTTTSGGSIFGDTPGAGNNAAVRLHLWILNGGF